MSDFFQEQLQALHARSLHRKLHEIGSAQGPEIQIVGRQLVNFSSDDYLGLAADPLLREAAIRALEQFGVGAGASRLISGTQSPHVELEDALASWKGVPAALAFSSGYAAAIGTLPALATREDVVILDKSAPPALIDGARLSGATLRVFPHNHLGQLESQLEWAQREHPQARIVIVVEAVSAVEGDRAPLGELIELKKRADAFLLLDETHASGVLGSNGRGLAAELGLTGAVDAQIGSLGKALGASGGYVCGSRSLVDWLINRARSFVFSTAPPPALAAAATAAIHFLASPEGEARRLTLWRRIVRLKDELGPEKKLLAQSESAILPWMVGETQRALELARALRKDGLFVPALRFPTVPKGAARLRISMTAAHSEEQVERLGRTLRQLASEGYGWEAAERRKSGVGT